MKGTHIMKPTIIQKTVLLPALLLIAVCSTLVPAQDIELPEASVSISGEPSVNRYFDVVGRKAFLMGYEAGEMEAWILPFKIAHALSLSFDRADFAAPVKAEALARWIEVHPEYTAITYAYEDFTVTMNAFVPLHEPAIVMLLKVDTAKEITVSLNFVTDMRPMWPAGLGGQSSFWNGERKAFVLSESRRRYNALIGSPAADAAFSTPAHRLSETPNRFDMIITPEEAAQGLIPLVIAGGKMSRDDAYALYDRVLENLPGYLEERAEHARYLREDLMSIDSPDDRLDEAVEWAKISLDDGISSNPDLGTGLIAGYGLSGRSERPGFAWYFGGDLFQAQFSLNGYGAQQEAMNCLEFIRSWQREDGKIMHELSQGAGFIDWFEDYPYGFYHLETSPYYILSVANTARHTGALEYLRTAWPSLIKAYEYTLTTESNGDGLPENRLGGLGAIEVGAFREMMMTDIYVAGVWVRALDDLVELAALLNEPLPEGLLEIRETARQSLQTLFWDEEKGYHGLAIDKQGRPISELTPWAGLPMTLELLPADDALSTLRHIAGPLVATDWTVRMVSTASEFFDPVHYNLGAAWGVLSGYAGMGQYNYRRPQAGWQIVSALKNLTFEDSRGDISEVYSGMYHLPLKQSVDHQLFSTGGFMGPLTRGLVGFTANMFENRVRLAPQLPAEWNHFTVSNLHAGDHRLSMAMQREAMRAVYTLQKQGGGVLTIDFEPGYPLDTEIASVSVNGAEVEFVQTEEGTSTVLNLEFELTEAAEIEVHFSRMNWVELPEAFGPPGSLSQQIRFIDIRQDERGYTLELSGRSGWTYAAVFHFKGEEIPLPVKVPGEDDGSFTTVTYRWK